MDLTKHIDKLGLVGLIITVTILSFSLMTAGHYWGGDFSLYIAEAKALTDGSLYELIEKNTFSMQQMDWVMGPYAYPLGYPILLAPVVAIFGLDFIVLKLYTLSFLLLSIPCAYYLFKQYFKSASYAFALVFLLSLKLELISFANNVLSDLPSLFFILLSFWAMPKSKRRSSHILLGALFFFNYIIRDLGLFLLPAFFIYQVQAYFAKDLPKLKKLDHFIPYLVFMSLVALNKLVLPSMSANHTDVLLTGLTWDNIIWGLQDYSTMLFNSIYEFQMGWYWIVLSCVLFGVGALTSLKKNAHFLVFTLCYFTLLVIWPKRQGLRFLFQLYPFILFFILKGAEYLFLLLQNKWKPSKYIALALITALGCYNVYHFTLKYNQYTINYKNQSYSPELQKFYACIKQHTQEDDIIAFFKPRVLRLFTGRNSVWAGSEDNFLATDWQYWIPNNNQSTVGNYKCLCTHEPFRLLKKVAPSTFALQKTLYYNDFEDALQSPTAFSNQGVFVVQQDKAFSPSLQNTIAELGIQPYDLLRTSVWVRKEVLDKDPKKLGNIVVGINRNGKSILWRGFPLKETTAHTTANGWMELHTTCPIPEVLPTDVLSVYIWKPQGHPLQLDAFQVSLWREAAQTPINNRTFDRVLYQTDFDNQAFLLSPETNYTPSFNTTLKDAGLKPNDYIRLTTTVYRTNASANRTEYSNLVIGIQTPDKKTVLWEKRPIETQLDTLGNQLKTEWTTIEHWISIPPNAKEHDQLSAYVWRPESVMDGELYIQDLQVEVWKK